VAGCGKSVGFVFDVDPDEQQFGESKMMVDLRVFVGGQ
jgi:hypothetical protein